MTIAAPMPRGQLSTQSNEQIVEAHNLEPRLGALCGAFVAAAHAGLEATRGYAIPRRTIATAKRRRAADEAASRRRETLEERCLGGAEALFPDAAEKWDQFADQVERLWSIGEKSPGAAEAAVEPGDSDEDPLAGRVAARVKEIADDARVSTFERLGELPRAVAIMERRLSASAV